MIKRGNMCMCVLHHQTCTCRNAHVLVTHVANLGMAYIMIYEPSSANLVGKAPSSAFTTLFNCSSASINQNNRPRFDWLTAEQIKAKAAADKAAKDTDMISKIQRKSKTCVAMT